MKRNYPPVDPSYLSNEQDIIKGKLNELFSHSACNLRQVPITSRGVWDEIRRHVRIESTKGLDSHLVNYSTEHKYDYLKPFEALYCLESNQLLIYFNGFPLSLTEAYQLLIAGPSQFKQYRIFQQLNRTGCICLAPSFRPSDHIDSPHPIPAQSSSVPSSSTLTETPRTLHQADQTNSMRDILRGLRASGPKDYELTNLSLQPPPSGILNITFEVYRRETFTKNKPRKGKQGNPDYQLIICDKQPTQKLPNCKQLLHYSKHSSVRLLFALIDDDMSICFTQFKPMNPHDLALF